MKNTIADISAQAYHINKSLEEVKASISLELHELYSKSDDINGVLKKLENMEGGEYHINEYGDLTYLVEVPQDIANLPEINDYLTKDYAFIHPRARRSERDLFIGQSCGEFISVNYYAERSFFVYDNDNRRAVIEKHEDWMSDQYVRAIIERYQRAQGVFGDVVKVGYHGEYLSHFETLGENLTDIQLGDLIEGYEVEAAHPDEEN
jgi:hypothetical protein